MYGIYNQVNLHVMHLKCAPFALEVMTGSHFRRSSSRSPSSASASPSSSAVRRALPVATTVHRRDAQADAMLRNWAEAIKAKPFTSTGLCAADDSNPYSVASLQGGSYLPADFSRPGFSREPARREDVGRHGRAGIPRLRTAAGAKLARLGLTVRSADTVRPVSESLEVVVAAT